MTLDILVTAPLQNIVNLLKKYTLGNTASHEIVAIIYFLNKNVLFSPTKHANGLLIWKNTFFILIFPS